MRTLLPLINADERRYLHSELTEKIIAVFYEVYNELGHGFLESVYAEAMSRALRSTGLTVEREVCLNVWFRGEPLAQFRADLLVNHLVLIELKAVKTLEPVFEAQLLNYLRATEIEVGLLLNFGPRPIVRRLVFSNERKNQRSSALISG
jgi:GxxExxY protein